eukprot:2348391-Lingulodinium_polyedra.AAC.1
MAAPPCLPPRGPGLATVAATLACGIRPAAHTATVGASQCVSWTRMVVSAATASSRIFLLANA